MIRAKTNQINHADPANDRWKMFLGTFIAIVFLLGTAIPLFSQAKKKNPSTEGGSSEQSSDACVETLHLKCMDLCGFVRDMLAKEDKLHLASKDPCQSVQQKHRKDEDAMRAKGIALTVQRNGIDIEVEASKTKQMRQVWVPDHSDIRLSFSRGQQVKFYCSGGGKFSIEKFERAAPLEKQIDNPMKDTPASPFDPNVFPFPTGKVPETVLGPPWKKAVGQKYKFTFTTFLDLAHPNKPCTVDPHLIVMP